MWNMTVDGHILYDPRVADRGYTIFDDAALAVELSKASRLSFTVPEVNPSYGDIKKKRTIVELTRSGKPYFRGRVAEVTKDFYNSKSVVCESELAYLNDSIQRPFTFPQEEGKSDAVDFLTFLISRHNPQAEPYQRFAIGRVTVADKNAYIHRSDTEYSSTWKLIKEGLLDKLGGFLVVRRVDGVNYLDYLAKIDAVSGQSVDAQNLLNIESKEPEDSVLSAVIPLGAKDEETGERLTLADIPDETTDDICKQGDTLYSKAAVAEYGRITQVRIFDNVTTTDVLKRRGIEALGEGRAIQRTTEITAADLSGAGYDVEGFYVGYNVRINSPQHKGPHYLAPSYLVRRMDLKLFHPGENVLTVGATTSGFLQQSNQSLGDMHDVIIEDLDGKIEESNKIVIEDLDARTSSLVQQSNEAIRAEIQTDYYTKEKTEELVGTASTTITATVDGIEKRFQVVQEATDANSEGLKVVGSYIREKDGTIRLGRDDDDTEFLIGSSKAAFVEKGTQIETAYISEGVFHAPRMSVEEQLDMGGWRLSTEGPLTLRWIGG